MNLQQKIKRAYCYNLTFFFDFSAFINFSTASKSSSKKFDTPPLGTTKNPCKQLIYRGFYFSGAETGTEICREIT